MKCPKCGKEVPEGKSFCGFCGFNLVKKQIEVSEQAKTIKDKKKSTPQEEARIIVAKKKKSAKRKATQPKDKIQQKKKVNVWLFVIPISLITVFAIVYFNNQSQYYYDSSPSYQEPIVDPTPRPTSTESNESSYVEEEEYYSKLDEFFKMDFYSGDVVIDETFNTNENYWDESQYMGISAGKYRFAVPGEHFLVIGLMYGYEDLIIGKLGDKIGVCALYKMEYGPPEASAHIIFENNYGNKYDARVWYSGYADINKETAASSEVITHSNDASLDENGWNEMCLIKIGNEFILSSNGHDIISVYDSTINFSSGGFIGLGVSSSDQDTLIEFDEVYIFVP